MHDDSFDNGISNWANLTDYNREIKIKINYAQWKNIKPNFYIKNIIQVHLWNDFYFISTKVKLSFSWDKFIRSMSYVEYIQNC